MTTTSTPTDEVIAYLTAHGFTLRQKGSGLWVSYRYVHATGNASVEVLDDEAACFTVRAFTRDHGRNVAWEVRLIHAPLAVFAATISAAID